MKNLIYICFAIMGIFSVRPLHAQTTFEMYLRLTDASGVLSGPVSSIPGVSGGNFFQVGCAEHQIEASLPSGPGGQAGMPSQSPFLITRPFDPATSPYIRQQLHTANTYTVELYFVSDNGSTRNTIFQTRLQNAYLTKFTTAADANGLQETFSFLYDAIIWYDMVGGTSRGWDVANNRTL